MTTRKGHSSLSSPRPPPTGPEPEVICPLSTRDGKSCRKKCVGDKRFRSMQEHIRRAHAEHYIPKLPASEESFYLMINTPPKEDPNPAAEAEAEAQASLSIQRSDAPDGMIAHEIQPAPGAPFENALFESFMDDIAHIRGVPEATLLLPDELTNHGIPRASGRSSIDFASAPALDSDPLSAITSEYHASVAQLSEANSIPQDPSMATLHQHISMPVSIWDDDDLQPLPGEDVVTVCNQGTASAEIMNGTYPFFDGDCSMFPNPEPAEQATTNGARPVKAKETMKEIEASSASTQGPSSSSGELLLH
ncbi:hypothetical protein P8C59_005926 [Phyllachora maydis]|uniref:Uncharacterized protein n=1 Tax=Phyllachora maydis TaxID=1825666 RepID=A0AAD9MCR5_9PEZI|nr:hypothetical protein P8C59_005926 [Phyllachora maydis]